MNNRARAFTIVELLTVIAVISILVGLTVPALNEAKWMAKQMSVKADIKNYELGLNTFYNDMGFYPSSTPRLGPAPNNIVTVYDPAFPQNPAYFPQYGAQILYESLVGFDRRGYQKDHFYAIDNAGKYYAVNAQNRRIDTTRSKLYVDLKEDKIGSMMDFIPDSTKIDDPVYNYNQMIIDGLDFERPMPILYYRAHKNRDLLYDITPGTPLKYQYIDNVFFTSRNPAFDPANPDNGANLTPEVYFSQYIHNPTSGGGNFAMPSAQPYNPETFLLISAGRDGIFGPNPLDKHKIDDISNFERVK